MAQQPINVGSSANDGTGDPLRDAFGKVNDNFSELYSKIRSTIPSTPVGTSGDVAGTLAYGNNYLYVCFADYDGVTAIWRRVSTATW